MTPSFVAAYHNHHLITAPQTLRFTPNAEGGYDVAPIPYDYSLFDDAQDKNKWGECLVYDDDQMRLPLGFEFPFYNQFWSELCKMERGCGLQADDIYAKLIIPLWVSTIHLFNSGKFGGG